MQNPHRSNFVKRRPRARDSARTGGAVSAAPPARLFVRPAGFKMIAGRSLCGQPAADDRPPAKTAKARRGDHASPKGSAPFRDASPRRSMRRGFGDSHRSCGRPSSSPPLEDGSSIAGYMPPASPPLWDEAIPVNSTECSSAFAAGGGLASNWPPLFVKAWRSSPSPKTR